MTAVEPRREAATGLTATPRHVPVVQPSVAGLELPVPTGESRAVVANARQSTGRRALRKVNAYIALTKPRIIELLLVTTVPSMILAQQGLPSVWLILATLVGGSLAAGSANTLNMYIDRDIDKEMRRTDKRPLVTGEVSPRGALVFGVVLGVVSFVQLTWTVNLISAVLALAAILLYVFFYTMLLKRRTPQNIVWGGVAGCLPALIGWSSVTGRLDVAPFVLFGIVFLWTPPHYWPLSLRYKDDYAAAGVPMLPVVADAVTVAKQIVVYSWVMVAWSLLLIPTAPTGPIYAVSAVLLGAGFIAGAYQLLGRATRDEPLEPMRLFHGSITYLSLLFIAVAVDPLVGLHF